MMLYSVFFCQVTRSEYESNPKLRGVLEGWGFLIEDGFMKSNDFGSVGISASAKLTKGMLTKVIQDLEAFAVGRDQIEIYRR